MIGKSLVALLLGCASVPSVGTNLAPRTDGQCIAVCERVRIADNGAIAEDCAYDCNGDGIVDKIVFNPPIHPYCPGPRGHLSTDAGLCYLSPYTWENAQVKIDDARERAQK